MYVCMYYICMIRICMFFLFVLFNVYICMYAHVVWTFSRTTLLEYLNGSTQSYLFRQLCGSKKGYPHNCSYCEFTCESVCECMYVCM